MTQEHGQLQDLVEIRSMMERSSRFMSISGFAGILIGLYALAGAAVAYNVFEFNPVQLQISDTPDMDTLMKLTAVYMLGGLILFISIGTALFLTARKAAYRGEKSWNATSRQLIVEMAVPLFTGGGLVLIILSKGLIGLLTPVTLIFYGLALFSASKFTYHEVRYLGVIQMILGLLGAAVIHYGLLFWVLGFGVAHVIFGIYLHFRYER